MASLNRYQLESKYKDDSTFMARFERLYSLRLLLARSITSANYSPPRALSDAIVLAPAGDELIAAIKDRLCVPDPTMKVALFLRFYFEDILVDLTACDAEKIESFLNDEVISAASLRYPWIFDRELYDRYFHLFGHATDHLTLPDTERLLEGSSPGVFQLGHLVIGPFGLLKSTTRRCLLPTRALPLWHCSDLSCGALHTVEVGTGGWAGWELSDLIDNTIEHSERHASEWHALYHSTIRGYDFYDDRSSSELPWLLANAFTEAELSHVLGSLFDSEGALLRPLLPTAKSFQALFKGNGRTIATRLSKAQRLQALLLVDDSTIIRHLEEQIDKSTINIPHTEIRTALFSRDSGSWLDTRAECSRYGVRIDSGSRTIGTDRLRSLVRDIYGPDDIDDLKWKLRHVNGDDVFERLDTFLRNESPVRALKELVLSNEEKTKRTLDYLDCQRLTMPTSAGEEEMLIARLLWKIGFAVRLHPVYQRRFWEMLEHFERAASIRTPYRESDEAAIRSAAANLFVALEEVLDISVSFSTWMLLSDHYGVTRYRFELAGAREFMAQKLSGRERGSQPPIVIEPQRQNTLFPMVQGFSLLADVCEEVLERLTEYKRLPADVPGFVGKTRIYRFPFAHTVLVGDIRTSQRIQVLKLLRDTTYTIETSKVADIRNRIEHKRDVFPQQAEIVAACNGMRTAIGRLETAGLCPSVYLYAGRIVDEFGRGQVALSKYDGSEIPVGYPSQFFGCKLPGANSAQIVVPSIHIGDSVEPLRFYFIEPSEYRARWNNYPRRVLRVVTDSQRESAPANSDIEPRSMRDTETVAPLIDLVSK